MRRCAHNSRFWHGSVGKHSAGVVRLLVCGVLMGLVLSGCTETRVIREHTPLAGLPGAQGGVRVGEKLEGYVDPTATPAGRNFILHEDGRVELLSKTGDHLLKHMSGVLRTGNRELFVEQVLSEQTKQEFIDRRLDPGEAFDRIVEREADFRAMRARMPLGENTPGVVMRKLGSRVYRVETTGLAARDLSWKGFDMVFEKGNWRLRWFVS